MRFIFFFLLTMLLFTRTAKAQIDTSRYNVWATQISKEFTQSITVKGADLQKIAINNLGEYMKSRTIFSSGTNDTIYYFVNGFPHPAAYMINIQDIDELIILFNPVFGIDNRLANKLTVLVKTYQPSDKFHVTINSQVNGLKLTLPYLYDSDPQRGTYQQHYLSVSGIGKKTQYGASFTFAPTNYTRKQFQDVDDNSTIFRAWGKYNINPNNTVSLSFTNSSTKNKGIDSLTMFHQSKIKTNTAIFNFQYQSNITKNLTNNLLAQYVAFNQKANVLGYQALGAPGITLANHFMNSDSVRSGLLEIANHIQYHIPFKNITVQPGLSVLYYRQQLKQDNHAFVNRISYTPSYPDNPVLLATTANAANFDDNTKYFNLIPNISIRFKDGAFLQGGVNYRSGADWTNTRTNFFITTSINILKLAGIENNIDWNIYGTYGNNNADEYKRVLSHQAVFFDSLKTKSFYTGSTLALKKVNVVINYTFYQNTLTYSGYFVPPYNPTQILPTDKVKHFTHFLSISTPSVSYGAFTFNTSFNFRSGKRKEAGKIYYPPGTTTYIPERTILQNGAGLNSRINYKKTSLGIDLIYRTTNYTHHLNGNNDVKDKFPEISSSFFIGQDFTIRNKTISLFANVYNDKITYLDHYDSKRLLYGAGLRLIL